MNLVYFTTTDYCSVITNTGRTYDSHLIQTLAQSRDYTMGNILHG